MDLNRIKKNISNRDWSSKTKQSNINYIKGKLKQFGLNIPKYLQQASLSSKQIQSQTKRIIREIEKHQDVARQQANKPTMEKALKQLEKAVDKHNQLVAKQLNWLQNKLTDKRRDYLIGKEVQIDDYYDINTKHNMQYTNSPFKVFNADKLYFDSIESVKNMIKKIKNDDKHLTRANINKTLKNNYPVVNTLRDVLKGYTDDGNILENESKELLYEIKHLDGIQQNAFFTIWNESKPKDKYWTDDNDIEELNENIITKWDRILKQARKI